MITRTMQEQLIRDHWHIHPFDGAPISLRALKPKGSAAKLFPQNITYLPAAFPSSVDLQLAFEADALRLNAEGYNIYCVMNRISSDFGCQEAVKDADITHRTMLLIDIDRVGDTSCPATGSEIDAAMALGTEVSTYLANRGFTEPNRVHSGNGLHLYYRLDPVEETNEVRASIEALLKGVARKFNNEIVGIDTSVFNASRITKVVGTIARKGQESEGREFRVAKLL